MIPSINSTLKESNFDDLSNALEADQTMGNHRGVNSGANSGVNSGTRNNKFEITNSRDIDFRGSFNFASEITFPLSTPKIRKRVREYTDSESDYEKKINKEKKLMFQLMK